MQTFLPYSDPKQSAQVLDSKRLGKQRVEVIQIARLLLGLGKPNTWIKHPATEMWRGHEAFLIKVYLPALIDEFAIRGFKNVKCLDHLAELSNHPLVAAVEPVSPPWLTPEFCRAHQSNLLRKDADHYGRYFQLVPNNLPYIWPTRVAQSGSSA